jgi:hypothetical protein
MLCLLCSLIQINALFFFAEPKHERSWVILNCLMLLCLFLVSIGSFSM